MLTRRLNSPVMPTRNFYFEVSLEMIYSDTADTGHTHNMVSLQFLLHPQVILAVPCYRRGWDFSRRWRVERAASSIKTCKFGKFNKTFVEAVGVVLIASVTLRQASL